VAQWALVKKKRHFQWIVTKIVGKHAQPMSLQRLLHKLRPTQTRSFAPISTNSPPQPVNYVSPYQIFDRNAKRLQKDRAAIRDAGARNRTVDYVREEVAERMMERFMVI
jgi:NADH dehydrogenase [ubiquinone] 1 alpha subcomplex assembly factor 5